jgi:hypothetical protein
MRQLMTPIIKLKEGIMSDPKLYRVSAIQPIYLATHVNADNPTDAIKMCKKDMDSDGNEIEWKDYDIGFWYGYQAEEVTDEL